MTTGDARQAGAVTYRRASTDDIAPAYRVFRESLFDYLFRQALVDEATAKDPPIESGWARQSRWIEHLWDTAAENWVALGDEGQVIGWAMSVERGGTLELTHFFVKPGIQARGVGRALLGRAFPLGRGRHRVIIATQDAPALSLYLRSGVGYATTSVDFVVKPTAIEPATDLTFDRLGADDAAVELVASVEQAVLGHRREPDTRFLLGMRPAWAARRHGEVVGFAFGAQPPSTGASDDPTTLTGPMAALDPADMPALIDHVVGDAAATGVTDLYVACPLSNEVAVRHLLATGFRIDPFYTMILADEPSMRLDRWIHTGPVFIM